jgi:hypothetical protein
VKTLQARSLDPHGEEPRSGVSNHEARAAAFILRDAAKTPLLRMRSKPSGILERRMVGDE